MRDLIRRMGGGGCQLELIKGEQGQLGLAYPRSLGCVSVMGFLRSLSKLTLLI